MPALNTEENFKVKLFARMAKHAALLDFISNPAGGAPQPKAQDDDQTGAVWDITIIEAGKTLNGDTFPPEVLMESAPLFEGVPIFTFQFGGVLGGDLHHLKDEAKAAMPLGYAGNIVGVVKNVRWDAEKRALVGEAHIDDERVRTILKNQWIRDKKTMVGLSIDADGVHVDGVATKLTRANSVDIVTYPAAGGGFNRMLAEVRQLETTEAAWDGSKARFQLEQLIVAVPRAVLQWAQRQADDEDRAVRKSDLKIPFKEPNGVINLNAARAALAALGGARGGVDLPARVREDARQELEKVLAEAKQEAAPQAPAVPKSDAISKAVVAAEKDVVAGNPVENPSKGAEVITMKKGKLAAIQEQMAKLQLEKAAALKNDGAEVLGEVAGIIQAKLAGDGAAWPEAARAFLQELMGMVSVELEDAAEGMGTCPGIVAQAAPAAPIAAPAPAPAIQQAVCPLAAQAAQQAQMAPISQAPIAPAPTTHNPAPVAMTEVRLADARVTEATKQAAAEADAKVLQAQALALQAQKNLERIILRREMEKIALQEKVADLKILESIIPLDGVTIDTAGDGKVNGLVEAVRKCLAAHPLLVAKPAPVGQGVTFQESVNGLANTDQLYGRFCSLMDKVQQQGDVKAGAEARVIQRQLKALGFHPPAGEA